MRFLLLVLLNFLTLTSAQAEILPAIFYAPEPQQSSYCSTIDSASDWFYLMQQHIQTHPSIQQSRGLKKDVMRNLLVTWSYSEFLRLSPDSSKISPKATALMGHIYSNASHHLGRLVRYRYWEDLPASPQRDATQRADQALVTDGLLGRAVETMPRLLSYRLMQHSTDLYFTLSWVLGSMKLCGADYTLELVQKHTCGSRRDCDILPGLTGASHKREAIELLILALRELQSQRLSSQTQLERFATSFIRFEQFYLQHTMYNQLDIGTGASLGLLDSLRFIPFEGIKSMSFREWCQAQPDCNGSSIQLEKRILFDQTLIRREISLTQASPALMSMRKGHHMIQEVRELLLD